MKYFTVDQVADMLHMHPQRVRKAILDLKLGAFRKGERGSCLITQKQIDAFFVPAGAEWLKARK